MKYKIQLVGDEQVLFEIPLCPLDWSKEELENEFKATEESFGRFSRIFDALSHETRLRMMTKLLEERDCRMTFTRFMHELNLNPKIVWENSRKLEEGGLLEKTGRGQYSLSDFGQKAFMMMSITLHRLMKSLEEIEEF